MDGVDARLDMLERKALLDAAKALELEGDNEEADKCLTALIELALPSKDPSLAALYNRRGVARRMMGQYEDARSDFIAALDVSPDDEPKSLAYVNIADILRVGYSDFPKAHTTLCEALTFTTPGSLNHAKAVDQRGLVFVAQEEYDCAIASYKVARGICETLMKKTPNDDEDVQNRFGQIVHHLGVAYVKSQDPDKVEEAYESQQTALDMFVKLGDQCGISNSVFTIGEIALIKKDYDEAIAQYERGRDIVNKSGYARGIVPFALHLAEAHLAKGEMEKAVPYLERFRDGVLNKEITEHDIGVMKDGFNRMMEEQYIPSGLEVEGILDLMLVFD
jgi:tetratricopeptide (TPR) repeat protein